MANPPPYGDTADDTGVGPDGGPTAGTPLWVCVLGANAIGLVLLFVILHLTVGGFGPGVHTP